MSCFVTAGVFRTFLEELQVGDIITRITDWYNGRRTNVSSMPDEDDEDDTFVVVVNLLSEQKTLSGRQIRKITLVRSSDGKVIEMEKGVFAEFDVARPFN